MTENLENTQPNQIENPQPATQEPSTQPRELQKDDTQPIKPIKKRSRWRGFFIGLFGFLLLVGLGAYGGYLMGLNDRQNAESEIQSKQLMDQYQRALADIQLKHYDTAKQRLLYIIKKDAGFPGAQQKLTEVLALSVIPTPTLAPTLTPTPDLSGAQNAYLRALQLLNAQDWQNTLGALDILRKNYPDYKVASVDSMYYFTLRNLGQDMILKQGNLEGGIYNLTLAERFGPLDNTAMQLRDGARMYVIGASFWELNWREVVNYFSQVSPNIWDGDMTAQRRLDIGRMRYGDELFDGKDFCGAYDQYSKVNTLDAQSTARMNKAYVECFPPTLPPVTEVPTVLP